MQRVVFNAQPQTHNEVSSYLCRKHSVNLSLSSPRINQNKSRGGLAYFPRLFIITGKCVLGCVCVL